ncbi:TetR family transcriptional regulator [Microbacterium sp. gxy059]|uniref:TetR family transcriptional regulator n=1 Tax=Microbacterium sp. gxy059 TaxID=2957199 RepID=UPI003D950F1F
MTGRPTHDLDGIVDAAIALLDAYGLPDLSMRRLASELGVRASALYWHVENKQSLLAAVADRIVGQAAPSEGVRATAHALRDALLAHRDGAEVVVSTAALSLGSGAAHRRLADAFAAEGAGDPDRGARILVPFVLGHASIVQQRMQAAQIGAYDADPATVAAETRADFSDGLDALLAGLAPHPA